MLWGWSVGTEWLLLTTLVFWWLTDLPGQKLSAIAICARCELRHELSTLYAYAKQMHKPVPAKCT